MTATELWLRYVAAGGTAGETEVEGVLEGCLRSTQFDHNLIAVVLNDHLAAHGMPLRVAYRQGEPEEMTVAAVPSIPASDFATLLPHDRDAPRMARRYLAACTQAFPDWLIQNATLLTSELVTNAVQHGRPAVMLSLSLTRTCVQVAVTDAGDDYPRQLHSDPGSTTGWGLQIVHALANKWGVVPTDPAPGKTVWFQCSTD